MTFASVARDLCMFPTVGIAYSRPTIRKKLLQEATEVQASGERLNRRGDYRQAQECLEQSITVLEHLAPGSKELASNYHGLGRTCYKQGKNGEAIRWLRLAIDMHDSLDPRSNLAFRSYAYMGCALCDKRAYDEATLYLKKSIEIFELDDNEPSLLASSRRLLGYIFCRERSNAHDAMAHVERAVEYYELERPESRSLQKCYFLLGKLYRRQGLYSKAVAAFEQAIESAKRLGAKPVEYARLRRGLARSYYREGAHDKANSIMQEAVGIVELHSPRSIILPYNYNFLGEIATAQRHFDQAAHISGRQLAFSL